MITSSQIYWITRLDCIGAASAILAAISFFGMCVMFWFKSEKLIKAWVPFLFIPVFLFFVSLSILIPTTKEAVAIYCLPIIINNEAVQEIPNNTATFINEQLKSWIDGVKK